MSAEREKVADDIAVLAKAGDWEALRSYFTFWSGEDELAAKVIAWCRFFLPGYFRDTSPDFHYGLVRAVFSKQNEYLALPRGFAKAQSLKSKVLTPDGWTRIGDLHVGDFVMGADGKPKRVEGMSPTTEMDLYRLRTRDGRSTLCNLDHLWEVTCPSNTGLRKIVKTTREILKNFKSHRVDKRSATESIEYRYFIDTCDPMVFMEKDLPIDPYTLGVWLGDGSSDSGTVTTDDPEVFDHIPYETVKRKPRFSYSVRGIRPFLRKMDLLKNKHVPDVYKTASVGQRLDLLRGLIDSDGYVLNGGRNFEYVSARKRLFDDVVDLIRSLGGTATRAEQMTRFDPFSAWKPSYRLSARIGHGLCPAKIDRKARRWRGSIKTKAAIVDIAFETRGPGRCIKVDGDLYITDDYLVTHNTTVVQGCLAFMAAHRLRKFIVLVEKSFTEASEVLAAIRSEFAENPAIRQVYGRLVAKDEKGRDPEKARDAMGDILIGGTRLRAKGFNTPVRGMKSGQYRPDLIILDDVESDEHVRQEEQRRKYMESFTQGVIPAVDIGGSVKVFGTILHMDSLLKNLIDRHGGTIRPAFDRKDPEGTLLWPERWTLARLMEKRSQMENEGLGESRWAQEYLCEIMDDASRVFAWEWLGKTFKEEEIATKARNRYAMFDVADAKVDGRDYTALTVVDWDADNNWYVVHAKQRRVDILELVDWVFETWGAWKPSKIGVEKNAFEYQVRPLLRERSAERGVYPVVEELADGGRNKESRIVGALQGRFQAGKVFFLADPKDDTAILRGQLYDFPRGKFVDLADSLSYLSDIGTRPFSGGTRSDLLPAEHREMLEIRSAERRKESMRSIRRL